MISTMEANLILMGIIILILYNAASVQAVNEDNLLSFILKETLSANNHSIIIVINISFYCCVGCVLFFYLFYQSSIILVF